MLTLYDYNMLNVFHSSNFFNIELFKEELKTYQISEMARSCENSSCIPDPVAQRREWGDRGITTAGATFVEGDKNCCIKNYRIETPVNERRA